MAARSCRTLHLTIHRRLQSTITTTPRLIASQRRRSGTLDFYSSAADASAFTLSPTVTTTAAGHLESLLSHWLPKGYPHTVAPEYLRYSLLTNASIGIGSAAGVLTTQSLLCAAGLTQGGSAATGAALAGTLNWVLKDGIGQLAAVVSASLISDRFDTDAKRWRMTAAGCENGARALESIAPFVPGGFLLVASLANLGKSVACIAAAATRAAFHRYLARNHNLADLTGKAGSQAIASSLLGTNLGILISASCCSEPAHVAFFVSGLSLLHMHTVSESLRCLALPTLTLPAAEALVELHLDGYAALPTPAAFAEAAPYGYLTPSKSSLVDEVKPPQVMEGDEATTAIVPHEGQHASLAFGSSNLEALAPTPAHLIAMRDGPFRNVRHLLAVGSSISGEEEERREVRVLLEQHADADDVLLALSHACRMRRQSHDGCVEETLEHAVSDLPKLRQALLDAGWDVARAGAMEQADARVTFH